MGSGKKKEGSDIKLSVGTTTLISTLKKQSPKEQEKPEQNKNQTPVSAENKEVKVASVKAGEVSLGGIDRPHVKVSEHTGKDRQRYWEWVRFKTPIKIKLINGEIFEGHLKWYDQFAVKLITTTDEIVIPKHSILCIFDGPKPKREVVVGDT